MTKGLEVHPPQDLQQKGHAYCLPVQAHVMGLFFLA